MSQNLHNDANYNITILTILNSYSEDGLSHSNHIELTYSNNNNNNNNNNKV